MQTYTQKRAPLRHHVRLVVTICSVAHRSPSVCGILQARKVEWIAIPDPGIEPASPWLLHQQVDSLPLYTKKYTNTHTQTQTRTYTWKTHKHTKYTDNIKHTHSHKTHTCINSQTPGCSWQQHQFWLTASTAQVLFRKGTCEQVYPCKGTCPAIKNNEAEFPVLMGNDVRGLSDRKVY